MRSGERPPRSPTSRSWTRRCWRTTGRSSTTRSRSWRTRISLAVLPRVRGLARDDDPRTRCGLSRSGPELVAMNTPAPSTARSSSSGAGSRRERGEARPRRRARRAPRPGREDVPGDRRGGARAVRAPAPRGRHPPRRQARGRGGERRGRGRVRTSRRGVSKASRYVIEQLKKRSPIWKQEHYADGDSGWLPGHSLRPQVPDGGAAVSAKP